jgi:hypothetical protein
MRAPITSRSAAFEVSACRPTTSQTVVVGTTGTTIILTVDSGIR